MKLQVICNNCDRQVPIKQKATDRGKMLVEYGKTIQHECPECGHRQEYGINRVFAIENRSVTIIALVVSLFFVAPGVFLSYLFDLKTAYSTIIWIGLPATIYATIISGQKRKVRMFNSFRV